MNSFFEREYFSQLKDYIQFKSQENPAFAQKAQYLLSAKENELTQDERYTKGKMLLEVERLATKATKESFFDYAENPMFVANMEQYVPFANFLFNSAKIFSKNPVAWITAMNFSQNIMNEFSTPEIDVDGEDLRSYVNMNRFALPILGAL